MTPRSVAFATSPGIPERFARHALVEGWEHERIARLRVAVLGVGALGNEVVKNLALLGVGHLLLVDKDRIETSNLSRSVLFREGDLGREKAVVAAARAVELFPGLDAVPLVQDLGQDLGPARLESYHVAVACLDSIDARLRVIDIRGEPIPGLHAAGEALGHSQTSGKAYVGGMSVTPALSFGRLLGQTLPLGQQAGA